MRAEPFLSTIHKRIMNNCEKKKKLTDWNDISLLNQNEILIIYFFVFDRIYIND